MKKILIVGLLVAIALVSIGLVTAGNVFGQSGDGTNECNCICDGQGNCVCEGQGNCVCDGQCDGEQCKNQYMNGNCLKNSNPTGCCKIN